MQTSAKSHMDALRQGTTAWHQWRMDNQSSVVDLRGINVVGLNLAGVDFSRCNLHGADLSGPFADKLVGGR